VEGDGMIVFGVDDDCEHGEGTACAQDASHGVGQEEIPDPFPAYLLVTGKPADERRRYRIVPRQLSGDLLGQVVPG
jgi:hypothetical protein